MIVEEKRLQTKEFQQLKSGQCFRFANSNLTGVFMKVLDAENRSIGTRLSSGISMGVSSSCPVIPVNIIAREE